MAFAVAEAVAAGRHDRGILLCGTGIGVCIAANKVPGAYAALCADVYSTERSRKSNNANIMTLGSQVVGPELAKALVTDLDAIGVHPRGAAPSPRSSESSNTPRTHQK